MRSVEIFDIKEAARTTVNFRDSVDVNQPQQSRSTDQIVSSDNTDELTSSPKRTGTDLHEQSCLRAINL